VLMYVRGRTLANSFASCPEEAMLDITSCFSPYGATTHSCGVPPRSFGFTPLAASSLVAGPMGRRRRGM
jgi:hypothetical protein